ncbi:unnamed protein product [Durusdinium trenchii]|uniref:Uncharacterized protein n=2 Tax=Durusdinium trenchii TaxID=1381693 RepID=A0ABP0IYE4_9DINO
MLGGKLPAPRRSRLVTADLWQGRQNVAALQELLRLQKQAQVCCTEGLEMNDLVVVVAKERRHFGRVCFVQYAERTSISVEVLPVQDIQLGASDLSVEFRFGRKRSGGGIIPDPQALKRSDVLKLPWPSLRKPPKPMTEQHLIEQEWDSLSKKRFSPGRLHSIWHDLDGQTRRRYRQLSTRAEEVYQQMLLSRFRVFSVLKELIDLAPGPALNGYFLYMQKSKQEKTLPPWSEAKEEFDQLAMVENAKLKDQQKLWIEVCLGGGWTLERSVFFPRSALKCMLTLLLCHKRSTLSCAKDISHHVWLEHIFPFIPCYWFAKVT